jgi:long-subunit acyl-CoA synthetase (AMP-forming)
LQASPLADALVFKSIKQRLGGRVRLVLSGAAPLARHVQVSGCVGGMELRGTDVNGGTATLGVL